MMRTLLLALTVAIALQVPAQTTSPAAEIRHARDASNQAWADRNLTAYAATITSDFTITTGSSLAYNHDGFLTLLRHDFPDPAGRRCHRTVDTIDLSTSNPLAAEHGHWRCTAQQPDGLLVATGTYLAMWRHEAGLWKTRSELFVTLACSGSSACAPRP